MSKENVDFIRRLFTAGESLDKQALLAGLPALISETMDPDVEWIEDPSRVDSRTYRGRDGVIASFTHWLEQWEEYGFEFDEFVDCGDEVFVVGRETAKGAASGAEVGSQIYFVVTVRGQKITRWREFYDENAARTAAGLTD